MGEEVRERKTCSQLSVLTRSFFFCSCYKSSKVFRGFRLLEKKAKERQRVFLLSTLPYPFPEAMNTTDYIKG